MKLQHHRFRFGLIGNLKVLICRIFGHRVNNDPTGFTCQRCRLAYEEIYYPADYWKEMIQFMKPKPENVEAKELVSALVDELTRHAWFPGTERQVDLFERCYPYLDTSEMPECLNHPPILDQRMPALDGSEMIGEETADEYLDRLVKKASPAWEGVDPQQFLDEIRGRMPEIEWKPGPPTTPGRWIVAVHGDHPFLGTKEVFHSHWASNHTGAVYCPSFPEVEEVKFHAAWPQYPDHV